MDCRNRVYYLVNLNQNHKRSGWWTKGWDNFGTHYRQNFVELKSSVPSLKFMANKRTNYPDYYQMMISCIKDEETLLVDVLDQLKDANYIKLNEV